VRIALTLEYDGTAFHGWQTQAGLRTVQAEVELALTKIAGDPIQIVCAGRTDAAVHAKYQVIHFDTQVLRPDSGWTIGVNHFLPKDIAITHVYYVPDDFHARFSAVERSYEYWIDNRRMRSALERNRMTWQPCRLNVQRMHLAAQELVGTHDFSAFRGSDCQAKSPIRTVSKIEVQSFEQRIVLKITANAFLHHMVRNIVGTLLPIGLEKAPIESLRQILEGRDRTKAGITAPPQGLYLCDVVYAEAFQAINFAKKPFVR
jgi:tRNA pseudouridine38-40 synthase